LADLAKALRELVAAPPVVAPTTGSRARSSGQAAMARDFATWVAIASISAGDRQS
jgi:hypothetical protein